MRNFLGRTVTVSCTLHIVVRRDFGGRPGAVGTPPSCSSAALGGDAVQDRQGVAGGSGEAPLRREAEGLRRSDQADLPQEGARRVAAGSEEGRGIGVYRSSGHRVRHSA